MLKNENLKIAVIGGGAAGFFCAINAAQRARQENLKVNIKIFESGSKYLKKVRISGGGRCNVTHNIFEVQKFCENYPRGRRELLSPMQQFQAKDTLRWFKDQGVSIVAESDGRMFPESNSSETIISTYMKLTKDYDIQTLSQSAVLQIKKSDSSKWKLVVGENNSLVFDSVLIATGSSPGGYRLAQSLGHNITDLAPSLFSFKISHPLLVDLQGMSFANSKLKLKIKDKPVFHQSGPLLITHWGLSGPAVLKLSAWAAREMKTAKYSAKLFVQWMGDLEPEQVSELIFKIKNDSSKSQIKNAYPNRIKKRFWLNLLATLKINPEKQWANISKKELLAITQLLTQSEFKIQGQNRFKEEFVECGGVDLKEVNFKTMESKIAPGVYFAGEILDIDGITGGFNFQNAWTTGWIAAQSMVERWITKS